MHVFYCKKCKADSATPVCEHCGAPIASLNHNERFKWRMRRLPVADVLAIGAALRILLFTVMALLLALFIGELIFAADKQAALRMFTASGVLPWALIALGGGAALALAVLALQGREDILYVLDNRGAHLQTWIAPSRIKCYARFLPYESYNITPDPEGNPGIPVFESHLLWEDVARFEIRRRAGRIDLYRPSGFRFLSLYPEREEFDMVLAYITPRMKQLAGR